MKSLDFLHKLKQEGKLETVDPSHEISQAYLIKSEKCTIAAKAVFNAGVYENAVSEAYYSMYNTVLALFFYCGIKCENHSASAILLRDVFRLTALHPVFSKFKTDRIDNQYYLTPEKAEPLSKEDCRKMLDIAERFNADLLFFLKKITIEERKRIRKVIDAI